MSRDNDEDSDGENTTPPQDDIQARNESSRHASPFGGFNANDEYEYEEPDRDIDYSSGYSTANEDWDEEFDNVSSGDEEKDIFSFEEESEEDYESGQPLAGEPDDWLENEDSDNDETEEVGPRLGH